MDHNSLLLLKFVAMDVLMVWVTAASGGGGGGVTARRPVFVVVVTAAPTTAGYTCICNSMIMFPLYIYIYCGMERILLPALDAVSAMIQRYELIVFPRVVVVVVAVRHQRILLITLTLYKNEKN